MERKKIITLSITIVLIGFSIFFIFSIMTNKFIPVDNQFVPPDSLADGIKSEIINKLKSSNETIVLLPSDIELNKNQEEFYFGIKNELKKDTTFYIKPQCTRSLIAEATINSIKLQTLSSINIRYDEVNILKMAILKQNDTTITTYECEICVLANTDSTICDRTNAYALKTFFLTVT